MESRIYSTIPTQRNVADKQLHPSLCIKRYELFRSMVANCGSEIRDNRRGHRQPCHYEALRFRVASPASQLSSGDASNPA